MKEAKNFLRQMFSARSGQISSKRVMGVMAFLAVLAVYVRCAIVQSEAPGITGEILLAATTLLGVFGCRSVQKN